MPQKLLAFVSLLSGSARSHLDTYKQRLLRPVSEVPDVESLLGRAGRYVDPVFQHSRRHYVGFVLDLVVAGSIWFVEDGVFPRTLGLGCSSLMLVQATDIF